MTGVIFSGIWLGVGNAGGGIPAFTTQPAITGTLEIGETLTLTEGVATNGATLSIILFELDGVDKSGELVGLDWDTTGESPGTISYQVRATNSEGSVDSDLITATLADASGGISQIIPMAQDIFESDAVVKTDHDYSVSGLVSGQGVAVVISWLSSVGSPGNPIVLFDPGGPNQTSLTVDVLAESTVANRNTVAIAHGVAPDDGTLTLRVTTNNGENHVSAKAFDTGNLVYDRVGVGDTPQGNPTTVSIDPTVVADEWVLGGAGQDNQGGTWSTSDADVDEIYDFTSTERQSAAFKAEGVTGGETFDLAYSNPFNSGRYAYMVFKPSLSGPQPIATTQQTSITHNGVTFTLDRAMPVGVLADGEPFVVSDQTFEITSITPAAADIQSDGFVGNGAMKNPYFALGTGQGFDGYLSDDGGNSALTAASDRAYDGSLNVDPGVSGNLQIATGERASIVKSVRLGSVTAASNWQTIEKYVTLTVLDTSPEVGTLRPGFAGTTKKLRKRSDIMYTPRNYTLPASFPAVSTVLSEVPDHIGIFESQAEYRRRTRLDSAVNPAAGANYSGTIVAPYSRYIYLLNSDAIDAAQREQIETKIIQFANDIESMIDEGFRENAVRGQLAGQGGGVWEWLIAAAAITRDSRYLNAAELSIFQPTGNCFWIDAQDVGIAAPGGSGVSAQTFFDGHIGIPHIVPDEEGSHHSARYLMIASHILGWEYVAALSFNQGPVGFSDGLAMLLNNGAQNDIFDDRTAGLAFMARRETHQPLWVNASAYDVTTEWLDLFDQQVNLNGVTRWTGEPDEPPMGTDAILDDTYFAVGGDGEITLDTQGIDYATETVTRRDMRYSLDRIQWVEVSDITLTGDTFTQTGLLRGAEHWCGWRMASATGNGVWSANYPYSLPIDSGNDRSKVTTTGTDTPIAPDYSGGVNPALHKRLYPAYDFPIYQSASGTLGVNEVQLAAGAGYPTVAFPAPTFTYQWQRSDTGAGVGFTDIVGETNAEYSRTAADAGKFLRCRVTATNAEGSDTRSTNELECPALTIIPASTLIDTQFRGAFAIDYETELAAVANNNATIEHRQNYTEAGLAHSFGVLYGDKTGSFPSFDLPLKNPAVAGQTYNITAEALAIAYASFASFSGDLEVSIRNATGDVFFTDTFDSPGDAGVSYLRNINSSFTVPGVTTDLDLFVRVENQTATGANAGGDVALASLTIIEA